MPIRGQFWVPVDTSGALRKRCQALIESVEDSLGGLAAGQVQLRAECGSAFFADLVAH